MSRFGSKLENLFLRRVLHSVKYSRSRHGLSGTGGGRAGSPAPTSARGPADEVQRVPRWCKVLHVYLPACGASAPLKNRRRRRGAARRGSREGSYSSWCTFNLLLKPWEALYTAGTRSFTARSKRAESACSRGYIVSFKPSVGVFGKKIKSVSPFE
jgi:hypothetical protein